MRGEKLWLGLIIALLLCSGLTVAEDSEAQSLDWLQNNSHSSLTIEELSYTILALKNGNRGTSDLITRLNDQKDSTQGCWPASTCEIKDTSLAYLALATANQNVEDIETYLNQPNALIPGVTAGEWRIQIETAFNGTCHLDWGTGSKDFQINGNQITPTAQQYYIDVAQDLDPSLVTAQVNSQVNVDCSEIAGAIVIALVYKQGNDMYILQNVQSARAMDGNALTLKNGCYGTTVGAGTCDYETSLYATWAQVEAGRDLDTIGTQTYIESGLSNNELHRGVLARTLAAAGAAKTVYFDEITNTQQADGSWSAGDILTSAYNLFALQQATGYSDTTMAALEFLKRVNANDGSWNQDVLDTSIALIAIKGTKFITTTVDLTDTGSEGATEICDDSIDNDDDGFIDCGDGDCDTFFMCDHCNNGELDGDEEDIDCGGTCAACTTTDAEFICYDGVDNDGDGSTDCDDLDCEYDDSCLEAVDFEPSDPVDTEEKSFGWIWALILLLVLGGGGAFFYMQYVRTGKVSLDDIKGLFGKKKKTKKLSFQEHVKQKQYKAPQQRRPVQQQPRPQQTYRPQPRPVKSKDEDELERSLREAERLLKGGK